jgi:hypothetical protein
MRVGVAREQGDLEEQEARRPHRRRAAEPRQDELADEWLDLKEQERGEEDGQRRHEADPRPRLTLGNNWGDFSGGDSLGHSECSQPLGSSGSKSAAVNLQPHPGRGGDHADFARQAAEAGVGAGEQELVIFAVVQRVIERRASVAAHFDRIVVDGHGGAFDHRADAESLQMCRKSRGEPVAQVDHRGDQAGLSELVRPRNTRGSKVMCTSADAPAERAADVDRVARLGATARDGSSPHGCDRGSVTVRTSLPAHEPVSPPTTGQK